MEKKISLWQRIISDTPAFFKRIQILGIGFASLGGTLANIHGIPTDLTTTLISVGATIIAVAQFAVKLNEEENTEK